ncbi:MAG: SdrD B-like domain-containing protein, partial [bacterium]
GSYLFANLPVGAYVVVVDEGAAQFPARYYETANPNEAGVCQVCEAYGGVILSNASNLNLDFGYKPYGSGMIGDTVWFDQNGDGIQSGPAETGITNVQVNLLADLNGDGTYVFVLSNRTDAVGHYLFSNLPDGSYRVQVSTNDTALPTNSFGNRYAPSTATNVVVTITGGSTNLNADFGFSALGAMGGTVFWDGNGNGTQDANEVGVANVTVSLYIDSNTNGVYDSGEPFVASVTTTTDGSYYFSSLRATNYVVVVSKTGPIATTALTADPSVTGVACTNGMAGCDNQYGLRLGTGQIYMGADFGYQPPGVIGDQLWIDVNNNGVMDAGEPGIPYVPVVLYSGATAVATNVTDASGAYQFINMANGTYTVKVNTNDSNFPTGVVPVFDADGTNTPSQSTLTISSGGINTNQDFGYKYSGANALSGTVGLDATPYDGLLGTNGSGTLTNEDDGPRFTQQPCSFGGFIECGVARQRRDHRRLRTWCGWDQAAVEFG